MSIKNGEYNIKMDLKVEVEKCTLHLFGVKC
jgi:hypothetical protein